MSHFGSSVENMCYPYPESGLIIGGSFIPIPLDTNVTKHNTHNVSINMILSGVNSKMDNYPTPRRGITHPSAVSARSIHDLPTILVNCEESRDEREKNPDATFIPNVNYIEWLMGYEADWTRLFNTVGSSNTVVASSISKEECFIKVDKPIKNTDPKKYGNGMHILMTEHPGQPIPKVAELWRALSEDERTEYKKRARANKN
jgi:hypothetical protein